MLTNSEDFKERLCRLYAMDPVNIAHHLSDILSIHGFNPRQVRAISRGIDKLIDFYLERHPELDGDEYIHDEDIEVDVIDAMSFDITVKLSEHLHFQVQYDITDLDEIMEGPYLPPKVSYSPYIHEVPALKLTRQEGSDGTTVNVVEYVTNEEQVTAKFIYPTINVPIAELNIHYKPASIVNGHYTRTLHEGNDVIIITSDINVIRRAISKQDPDMIDAVINNLVSTQAILKDIHLKSIYVNNYIVRAMGVNK